jgi:hypothetical protein
LSGNAHDLTAVIPQDADHHEVLTVLENHYESGGMDGERIVYPNRQDYSVRVTWEDGRIRRLEPGPAFRSGDDDSCGGGFRKSLSSRPGPRWPQRRCSLRLGASQGG